MNKKYCKNCKTDTWHTEYGLCIRCKTLPETKEKKEKDDTPIYCDTDSIILGDLKDE